MAQREDYNALIETLKAIPQEGVQTPDIPASVFAQEAENLVKWAEQDREALEAVGLDWSVVETLPVRAGALRQAESDWLVERYNRQESQKNWSENAPVAYNMRVELLHAFRYAYGKFPNILNRVKTIDSGNGHADMIQDLNSLATLGRKHPEPLQAINFDTARLDEAEFMADQMANTLAESIATTIYVEAKDIRDRAYTYLKQAVSTIREAGQYVFWRDTSRAAGYASDYLRSHRADTEKKPVDSTEL